MYRVPLPVPGLQVGEHAPDERHCLRIDLAVQRGEVVDDADYNELTAGRRCQQFLPLRPTSSTPAIRRMSVSDAIGWVLTVSRVQTPRSRLTIAVAHVEQSCHRAVAEVSPCPN